MFDNKKIEKVFLIGGLTTQFSLNLNQHQQMDPFTILRTTILIGHSDDVNALCIKDNLIISGSHDNTIKIWNVNDMTCLATLEGHGGIITRVCIVNGMLVSCSSDRSVKIWSLDTYECVGTLNGHEDIVWSVFGVNNLILSASRDATIKVWDIATHECLKTLVGSDAFTSVYVKNGLIVGGTDDGHLHLWDCATYDIVNIVEIKGGYFTHIMPGPGDSIVYKSQVPGKNVGEIVQCDLKTMGETMFCETDSDPILAYSSLFDRYIVSASMNSVAIYKDDDEYECDMHLNVWDTHTNKRVDKILAGNLYLSDLACSDRYIVASNGNGAIIVKEIVTREQVFCLLMCLWKIGLPNEVIHEILLKLKVDTYK